MVNRLLFDHDDLTKQVRELVVSNQKKTTEICVLNANINGLNANINGLNARIDELERFRNSIPEQITQQVALVFQALLAPSQQFMLNLMSGHNIRGQVEFQPINGNSPSTGTAPSAIVPNIIPDGDDVQPSRGVDSVD